MKQGINNIKLGLFVLGGLLFLVILLYMIGKNRNLFGNTYMLKSRFENVQGLVAGNNVRYAGIQVGTVKRITILNDTVIELSLIIEKKMQSIIRKNAMASIGSEGLVGNKVVNIIRGKGASPLADAGWTINSQKPTDTDAMLKTLSRTNNNISVISDELIKTIEHINNSSALWELLDDRSIPNDLRMSVANIRVATDRAGNIAKSLDAIINDVKNGKGSAGAFLKDSSFIVNLNNSIKQIKRVGDRADSLGLTINNMVSGLQHDINSGAGAVNVLLKDSIMATHLKASLENIQNGSDGFNKNMEALKHSFLLRGYFRKLERKKQRMDSKNIAQENKK